MLKRKNLILLNLVLILGSVVPAFGQSASRTNLPAKHGSQIGDDFYKDIKNLRPLISSVPLKFENRKAIIPWREGELAVEIVNDETLLIQSNSGWQVQVSKELNSTLYYPDTSFLTFRTAIENVEEERCSTETRTETIGQTRHVPNYVYDSETGEERDEGFDETYWEEFDVSETVFYTETVRKKVKIPIIPELEIYRVSLENGRQLLIYQIAANEFRLQHMAYLCIPRSRKEYCFFIDTNHNGSFFDPEDEILTSKCIPDDMKTRQSCHASRSNWRKLSELKGKKKVFWERKSKL
jgi:hypothetical protein